MGRNAQVRLLTVVVLLPVNLKPEATYMVIIAGGWWEAGVFMLDEHITTCNLWKGQTTQWRSEPSVAVANFYDQPSSITSKEPIMEHQHRTSQSPATKGIQVEGPQSHCASERNDVEMIVEEDERDQTWRDPNVEYKEVSNRRRRHKWWNSSCNREEEIVKVKGLMRNTVTENGPKLVNSDDLETDQQFHPIAQKEKSEAALEVNPSNNDNTKILEDNDGRIVSEYFDMNARILPETPIPHPSLPPAAEPKTCLPQSHIQITQKYANAPADSTDLGADNEAAVITSGSHNQAPISESCKNVTGKIPLSKSDDSEFRLIDNIRREDRRPFVVSCLTALKTVLKYCIDNNLSETAECLQREAPKTLASKREYETMPFESRFRHFLACRDFPSASRWFDDSVMSHLRSASKQGFQEIRYRLLKLEILSCLEKDLFIEAQNMFKLSIMPFIQRLKQDFPGLAEFLSQDIEDLKNSVYANRISEVTPIVDLETLCSEHSESTWGPKATPLKDIFLEVCAYHDNSSQIVEEDISLEYALECVHYRRNITRLLKKKGKSLKIDEKGMNAKSSHGKRRQEPAEKIAERHQQLPPLASLPAAVIKDEPIELPPAHDTIALKETVLSEVPAQPIPERQKSRGSLSRGRIERSEVDRSSTGSSALISGASEALEKLMPLPSSEHETADFALSVQCGPVMGHIRALAVQDIEPSRILVASSGGEDRSDRKISLWDARNGQLDMQLDNGTPKPVTCLAFHPMRKNLLLSADMDFDVKLWDCDSGRLLRCWKKHHRRVIWKIAFVPGRDDSAASCSGDQSLKIWNLDSDSQIISSAHANEPFTSFLFCGDSASQTVIASLSYVIRIYKLRTMSLLHTIQLKELKDSKTPISSLASHPEYENFVLISCDNQIRLFDLTSETQLRVYTARELGPGVRVEGNFSPCGTFVYCGSWDLRAYGNSVNRRASLPTVRTDRIFSPKGDGQDEKPKERGSPEAQGVYIWRVSTARLERSEMRAMEDASSRAPVTLCRWVQWGDKTKKGKKRKALIAATIDRNIKTYL
ncbi:hypothetical protein HDU67_005032 [Dinochytrium kinnereticum]|nr:hypothetical protein HDU67_005032 [Dinochytrium kinnereticum]